MLYFRQVLILFVSLYTVRVVLEVLGVEDFGIYSVVGGVVTLFSFLSGTMASASQRFFSFAIGLNDQTKLKKIFNVNIILYLGIACIAIFFMESLGLWYVKNNLNVPSERYTSVILLYQYAIFTFLATIIMSPFTAIIIAHEDMQIYAYISILEAILKLIIVLMLKSISWDKLELYGILTLTVSIITAFSYMLVCFKKYNECKLNSKYWDATLFKEIIGFTGWTLFGQLTTVFRNQAVTILLNQTFNPAVVAARAIALNINGQINLFSNNFNIGLYPPIIKSYASNNKAEMFSLIFNGSKITFFLMWIFALPIFLEMETILKIWLVNPPQNSVLFTQLALIESLITSISLPLTTAARAPGKMKVYEFTLGSIQILIFIIAWIVLKFGAEAYSVFIIAIIANLIMFIVRLFIVSNLIELPIKPFIKNVVVPVLIIIFISSTISFIFHILLPIGTSFIVLRIGLEGIVSIISIYHFGLSQIMKKEIVEIILKKLTF